MENSINNNNVSSKHDNEIEHVQHSNIEIMTNNEAYEVIEKLFKSLKKRYQNNLEKMERSKFLCDCAHLLHYKCHKINPNCGGSYIDFPD